ncbi:MAG: TPR repeat protein [Alphaproteobacteria bacterium]|jgi:TPR repeat protein
MSYFKYFLFLSFIVSNVNCVNAVSVTIEKSQQNNAEVCGERSCEFIFKDMRKFAKYGNPEGQAILSLLYADGIGTEIDQDLSLKYIKRAANSGLSFAEYNLGMLYRKSQIVGKYGKDADYWLMRAAKNNYKPAIDLLLSKSKISSEDVNNDKKTVLAPMFDKDTEVIVVNADKYSLTDFYENLKNQGYGNINQTGSRIKGRGCGNSAIPCTTWDIQSPSGQVQFVLLTLKLSR